MLQVELTLLASGHARMRGYAHSMRLVAQRHKVAALRPYGHQSIAGDEESAAVLGLGDGDDNSGCN